MIIVRRRSFWGQFYMTMLYSIVHTRTKRLTFRGGIWIVILGNHTVVPLKMEKNVYNKQNKWINKLALSFVHYINLIYFWLLVSSIEEFLLGVTYIYSTNELIFSLTPLSLKIFPHIAVHPKGLSRKEGKVSCKLARGMARGCWETAQFTKAHWVNPQKEQ